MNVQVIEKNGHIEWAVVSYADYQKLLDAWEMLEDIRAYDEAKANIEAGEELIPSQVAYAQALQVSLEELFDANREST